MKNKENEGTRINKYISDYGFCSRREADKLIDDRRVTINNRLATAGDRVNEGDKVRIDGEQLTFVPREARPKKHRWGPPRNSEENTEQQPTRRTGQRGVARNSKQVTPKLAPSRPTKGGKKSSNKTTKSSSSKH